MKDSTSIMNTIKNSVNGLNKKQLAGIKKAIEPITTACDMVLTEWHSKSSNIYKKEPQYLEMIRSAIQ